MLQLHILCLSPLQSVGLVLLGETRRQQQQQQQQQHGIPREHHASEAEKTTGASNYFAFLFLISVYLFSLFFLGFLGFFFLPPPPPPFTQSLTRKDTTTSIHGRNARIRASSVQTPPPSSSILPFSHTLLLSSLLFCSNLEDIGTSSPTVLPGDMDLWFHSIRICWWRVLFLMSIFQDYLSSMLDCPPTCSCSQTEIYCNKSDNGRFFPLLALQDTGSNGTSVDIAELFKNISSM